MRMLSILIPPTLTLALALAAGPALAQTRVGEVIGPERAKAEASLAAQGYKITEYEAEDGRLEIKAVRKDARRPERLEIVADARTGKVIRVERDGEGK